MQSCKNCLGHCVAMQNSHTTCIYGMKNSWLQLRFSIWWLWTRSIKEVMRHVRTLNSVYFLQQVALTWSSTWPIGKLRSQTKYQVRESVAAVLTFEINRPHFDKMHFLSTNALKVKLDVFFQKWRILIFHFLDFKPYICPKQVLSEQLQQWRLQIRETCSYSRHCLAFFNTQVL